jgi:hypothetical protein
MNFKVAKFLVVTTVQILQDLVHQKKSQNFLTFCEVIMFALEFCFLCSLQEFSRKIFSELVSIAA